MTLATTPEHTAVADAIGQWSKKVSVITTVRAGEPGSDVTAEPWPALFRELAELGVFAAAVPERKGGMDALFVDLAVMLEQTGHDLVPGPVAATALSALLTSVSGAPNENALLAQLIAGEVGAAVATSVLAGSAAPAAVEAERGVLSASGDLGLVAGYSPDVALLAPIDIAGGHRWVLLEPGTAGIGSEPVDALDFSMELSWVRLDNVVIPAHDVLHVSDAFVRAAIIAVIAAQAAGVARWTLDTAVEYAKVREQFGAPIGSFQAVKHICAEMLCRSEQVSAAAWDLASAVDELTEADGPARTTAADQVEISAAVAAAAVSDMVVANAKDCIQILGGIGFTFEHDAHLYLRRALAWQAQLGSAERWHAAVAELNRRGVRRSLRIDLSDVESRRPQVRATVEAIAAADDQRRALADALYLTPHWPAPFGLGADALEQVLIDEELDRAGVRRPDLVIAGWAIPTIIEHGTEAQRERFVEQTLHGEIMWCQLFSEPGAGSDLAALRTKATKVDGGWTLQGQKVWTSHAHDADWAICLARTDSEAPKHKGITYFLVDMTSKGIETRPLREITGRAMFNEVFLDDVFVPDECVVGEINNGWRLARTTLANERVAMGGSALGKEMEALLAQIDGGESGTQRDELTGTQREKLGGLIAQAQLGQVLDLRSVLGSINGTDPGAASSVRKLIGVRHRQAVPEFAQQLHGVDGLAQSTASQDFLLNRCLSIAGGTTQILATAAAERLLGLPR
ncbi:acyl-CoA dehydrogenase [Williamsia sp. 1138]|uniref:acyl-CoA dehydrogenase n=1 Tax=Williamsia sp. 1138 TaxID=1903117 RepID=UPI000A118586|nr:acyl-CoA dehydrogenase [Williamsia sp. 1138]OZG30680.1 acyl-CoA dehydrogenase [Williamsia sp. 1138]